jgi:hypothetical protein
MPTRTRIIRRARNRHPRPDQRLSPPAYNRISDCVANAHGETPVTCTFEGPLMFPGRQVFGQFVATTAVAQNWSVSITGTGDFQNEWQLAVQTSPGGEYYDFDVYGQLTIGVVGQPPMDGAGLPLTLGQTIEARYE